jgi:CBS-domain-containing membrane protein
VSEAVQLQLITVIGSILVAVVSGIGLVAVALLNTTRRHAKAASDNTAATRDQVTNSHSINLRDDLDAQFKRMNKKLDAHSRQISKLFRQDAQLAADLEQTRPRAKQRKQVPNE